MNISDTRSLAAACFVSILTACWTSSVSANVTSTFDTNADGWTHAPDGDPDTTVTFSPTGGDPGGDIVLTDAGEGANDFFLAPAKYLGNDSLYLNGTFSFDLMDNSSIGSLGALLTITDAAGDTLSQALPDFASGVYVAFSFTLNPSGGWTYTPAGGSGSAATQAEFQTVLANVSSLVVPGDFHNGTEMTSLDNVALSVPEPGTYAIAGLGLAVLAVERRRRTARARSAGGCSQPG